MLNPTQIATLKATGLFDEARYATFANDADVTFECLLWTSKRIFGDESLDDPDNTDAFDAVVEEFEARYPNGDYEKICMILECA
ncbi:hypothetical protein AHIS1_p043 [Acaryochloris phage A-HIS1]|nr:hypothetical protein AHIS1_p043 [Acaryochloris phage A-HIS1]